MNEETNGERVGVLLDEAAELRRNAARTSSDKGLGTLGPKLARDEELHAARLEREAENLAGVARRKVKERFAGMPITVEYIDGVMWRLQHDVSYRTLIGDVSTVRTGFEYDFASIPRVFTRIFPRTGDGRNRYGIAATWHDWLYRHGEIEGRPISRKAADGIFLEIMRYVDVNPIVDIIMYLIVRLFSGLIWKRYRRLNELLRKRGKR